MKPKTYKPHPAALAMPPMSEGEIASLADDISANGQQIPAVITSKGLLLDGVHRQIVCERIGVELKVIAWAGEARGESAAAYVVSVNDRRRHMNASQRALSALELLPIFQAEARERQKAGGAKGGRSGSKSAPGRTPFKSAAALAQSKGVGTRTVERAKALLASAPESELQLIREGKKTIKQVERETRRTEQVAQARAYVPPQGQFEVIVTDWPWEYRDSLEGGGMERGTPYPPMPISEICSSIKNLPVAETCALFAWVTTPILLDPEGWAVVYAQLRRDWGFVSKQMRTWVKTEADGGDFTGQGWVWRGDTEHLIRLERGRPVFNPMGREHGRELQRTSFRAPIGEHSEKPDRAYSDIAELCPQPVKLEMFARKDRAGWVTSGSELTGKGVA